MARMQFKGIEEYIKYLEKIKKNTSKIVGKGVYEMAAVVADQIKNNLKALPAVNDDYNIKAYNKGYKSKLSQRQKDGLIEGFGIAAMENENGYLHVKLGFDGYNEVMTKKYPNGQPNVLVARSVESGSSYMDKTPFVRPAVNASKDRAVERCKLVIDKELKAIEAGGLSE